MRTASAGFCSLGESLITHVIWHIDSSNRFAVPVFFIFQIDVGVLRLV